MRLSTRSRYAVRVLVELARRYGMGLVPLGEIAREQRLSPQYLESILRKLRKAGIVELKRGAGGGCRLEREPAQVTVWDVVREVEDFALAPCSPGGEGPQACELAECCPAQSLWQGLEDAVKRHLAGITLQELARHRPASGAQPGHAYPFQI